MIKEKGLQKSLPLMSKLSDRFSEEKKIKNAIVSENSIWTIQTCNQILELLKNNRIRNYP